MDIITVEKPKVIPPHSWKDEHCAIWRGNGVSGVYQHSFR
jgi:hypothetical protein